MLDNVLIALSTKFPPKKVPANAFLAKQVPSLMLDAPSVCSVLLVNSLLLMVLARTVLLAPILLMLVLLSAFLASVVVKPLPTERLACSVLLVPILQMKDNVNRAVPTNSLQLLDPATVTHAQLVLRLMLLVLLASFVLQVNTLLLMK